MSCRSKGEGERRERWRGRDRKREGEKFEDPVPAQALLGGGCSPEGYLQHPSSRARNRGTVVAAEQLCKSKQCWERKESICTTYCSYSKTSKGALLFPTAFPDLFRTSLWFSVPHQSSMPKADETMYVCSYVHIHTHTPRDEYEWTVVMQLLTCGFAPSRTSIISRSYLCHQMFANYAHGVPAAIAPCKMVTGHTEVSPGCKPCCPWLSFVDTGFCGLSPPFCRQHGRNMEFVDFLAS